jgi:transposase
VHIKGPTQGRPLQILYCNIYFFILKFLIYSIERKYEMSRMVFDDSTWAKLEQLLPAPKGRHGENDRLFLEAIAWVLRTGAPWRDLPPEYGNWKTIYNRFNRWVKKGHFEEIFKFLKKRWQSRHTNY